MSAPSEFTGVTVESKANVYFDGGVVSHTVRFADGSKKTLGLIRPGTYHFGTGAPERMEIVAGSCVVTLDGQSATQTYGAGACCDISDAATANPAANSVKPLFIHRLLSTTLIECAINQRIVV